LTGFKKALSPSGAEVIVTLTIPESARRSHAFGRKCRAEFALVTAIEGAEVAYAKYDRYFTYRVGGTVRPTEPFCEDFTQECASGIHFFITREEAMAHRL
jgi:hypothetical protein